MTDTLDQRAIERREERRAYMQSIVDAAEAARAQPRAPEEKKAPVIEHVMTASKPIPIPVKSVNNPGLGSRFKPTGSASNNGARRKM